jgi:hypothetical protein
MLGVQVLVDILVELLVGARRFRCVEIASAGNVAVGCVEVERARDGLEVLDGKVLERRIVRTSAAKSRQHLG